MASDKTGSLRALSLLNFFVSDVQTGMGPYLTLFLRRGMGWNGGQIGTAVGAGYLALVIAQIPVGAWIDGTKHKRGLVCFGSALVAVACLLTAAVTVPIVVTTGQAMIGVAGAILSPCIAAIALGLVGRRGMDARQGLNQAFNAGGNVAAAVVTGLVGQYLGLRWMFAVLALFCSGAVVCALRIRAEDIDNALARGADKEAPPPQSWGAGLGKDAPRPDSGVWPPRPNFGEPDQKTPASFPSSPYGPPELGRGGILDSVRGFGRVLQDRSILIFTLSALLLNLSNGAMAPLVTQQLAAQRNSHYAALWVGAFMIAVQSVYLLVAARTGRLASVWGRKPLYAAAFGAVALRGLLLSVVHGPALLVAVQSVDGVVAGIASVVSTLIIADLTKGTGRFNIAQGAFAAAQGLGASASNAAFGALYHAAGAHTSFLALGGVALAGLAFFWLLMPETRDAAA